MVSRVSANRQELLQIADAVAREKSIDKSVVIHAMEEAMQRAAKSRYGTENDIRVDIDPKTGETHISRYLHVIETVENDKVEISLEDARRRNPAAQVGDIIAETLPPIDYSRIATQMAKQVIVQKVRDAERERQYDEYKDRIGEIVHGVVKRVEFGSVVVDLGRAEGVVRRDEMIPRESFRNGDRIRAYIYDVRRETRGPQIFLSRTHPQFMVRLFAQEVPEIYDGIIEIRAVARDPGSRAKIAVISKDSSIDPVGACVGMRGVRVQAVVQELQGERIDIIPWSNEAATFIVNALAPAEVSKVVLDEDTHRVEVVVPDDQLSLGIGRRGQNVRLASQLTGWQIDILTEAEESERRQKEFAARTELFMTALDVDETVAQLLASEGFASVEDIAFVPIHELADIEGFDEDTATELQARAQGHIDQKNAELDEKRKALGVEDAVTEIDGITPAMLVALGENGVKTVEDVAGCANRRTPRLLRDEGQGTREGSGCARRLRPHRGRRQRHHHACARDHGVGDRSRSRQAGSRGRTRGGGKRGVSLAADIEREADHLRERRCIVTGEVLPEGRLVRFVVGPDQRIVPDVEARLPGRGIWVTADRESIARAAAKGLFARAAKANVVADGNLAALTEERIMARALALLGLARRAGDLTLGFDGVDKALRSARPPAVLVEASDGSEEGARKLRNAALAGRIYPFVIGCFSSAELGLALGLPNVVHASLKSGRWPKV